MSWGAVGDVIDAALQLPRKSRSNAIDHGQLRLLYRIAYLRSVSRAELDQRDPDNINAINKRLDYLLQHNLIVVDKQSPCWQFSMTEKGLTLATRLARGRSMLEMLEGFELVYRMIETRQLNAADLKILVYMARGQATRVPDLIEHTGDHRQTIRSRLKRLGSWGLIACEEKINLGGNRQYTHWQLTLIGRNVITALYPEQFTRTRRIPQSTGSACSLPR